MNNTNYLSSSLTVTTEKAITAPAPHSTMTVAVAAAIITSRCCKVVSTPPVALTRS